MWDLNFEPLKRQIGIETTIYSSSPTFQLYKDIIKCYKRKLKCWLFFVLFWILCVVLAYKYNMFHVGYHCFLFTCKIFPFLGCNKLGFVSISWHRTKPILIDSCDQYWSYSMMWSLQNNFKFWHFLPNDISIFDFVWIKKTWGSIS